jgi:urease accessory protein
MRRPRWPTGLAERSPAAGLAAGLAHPFGGLDHLLVLIAVGMLAERMGGRAVWVLPGAFLAALAAGFAVGSEGPLSGLTEAALAGSLVVLGGLAALGRGPPLAAASSIAALFALFHGHAHAAELAPGVDPAGFGLGLIAASTVLAAAGAATARVAGKGVAVRAGGAAIAVAGLALAAVL